MRRSSGEKVGTHQPEIGQLRGLSAEFDRLDAQPPGTLAPASRHKRIRRPSCDQRGEPQALAPRSGVSAMRVTSPRSKSIRYNRKAYPADLAAGWPSSCSASLRAAWAGVSRRPSARPPAESSSPGPAPDQRRRERPQAPICILSRTSPAWPTPSTGRGDRRPNYPAAGPPGRWAASPPASVRPPPRSPSRAPTGDVRCLPPIPLRSGTASPVAFPRRSP